MKKPKAPKEIPVRIADIFSGKVQRDFLADLKDIYHPDKMAKLRPKKNARHT